MRIAKRIAFSLTTVAVLAIAVIGFAHTKTGHPLLRFLGMASASGGKSCPFGYDKLQSADQKEAARASFAATHRGTAPAPGRPALGFTLDHTTRAEVLAWAQTHGVTCVIPKVKAFADLDCSNVPVTQLTGAVGKSGLSSLWLNFDKDDRLVAVIAIRHDSSPEGIAATFGAITADVTKEAGPPAKTDGDARPDILAAGMLRQASAEYRFSNYYALARAANMGHDFMITEEYRSL